MAILTRFNKSGQQFLLEFLSNGNTLTVDKTVMSTRYDGISKLTYIGAGIYTWDGGKTVLDTITVELISGIVNRLWFHVDPDNHYYIQPKPCGYDVVVIQHKTGYLTSISYRHFQDIEDLPGTDIIFTKVPDIILDFIDRNYIQQR